MDFEVGHAPRAVDIEPKLSDREPLDGIRVVEMTIGVLGPTACVYLSDMGAEVIKIEPPEGDGTRFARGAGNVLPAGAITPMVIANNRGKKSVILDGHSPRGREAILRLLRTCDIFVTNFREDALERLGLTYDEVREVNPRIIYGSGSGFGRKGPEALKAMMDGAGQARGGINSVTGPRGGQPYPVGTLVSDAGGGLQLALAVMTALVARERHGLGQRVEVSGYGALLWLQQWEIAQSSLTGHILTREGPNVPDFPGAYGIYETSDGGAMFFGFAQDDESWRAFWEFAGMAEVGRDPRWDGVRKRTGMDSLQAAAVAAEVRPLMVEAFRGHTAAEWRAFLTTQPEIVSSPVFTYADILEDPQAIENGYLVELEIPDVGRRRLVGNLVALSETPGSVKGLPAEMGQHTEEVLLELGYSWDEIVAISEETRAALRRKFAQLGMALDN